jgi:N-acylglucosamine-6-phosphate 2-epimerase
LVRQVKTPVVLEGRVWEPVDVRQAFQLGAFSVVIGSAVTRPHEITKRFLQAVPS